MANLGMNFDATQVEPNTGAPPPLPTDWYHGMITASEMKQTKDKTGGYLEIILKVVDGPHAGRQAWDRLNLYNQNQVAVEIAQKTLSAICHAVGIFQVQDSSVLHGRPLMFRAVEKDAEGGYDAGNDVKGYAKVGEKESKNGQNIKLEPRNNAKPATPSAPAGAMAGGPTFTPPWGAAAAPAAPMAPPAAPPQGWGPPQLVPETAPAAPAAPAGWQPPAQAPAAPAAPAASDVPPWLRK